MFVIITYFIICPEKAENPSTTWVIFYLPSYQLHFQVLVYLFVTNIQAGRPRVHDPSKISPDIAAPKQTIAETYNRDISTYNWPYYVYPYVNPSDVNGQTIQPVGISQSLPAPGVQVAQDPNGKWFWYNVQI